MTSSRRTVALALISLLVPLAAAEFAKTATAVLHDDDGIWGSIVFHQWSPSSPIFVSLLFQNIKIGHDQRVDWNIHDEPVHFENSSPDERCGALALKSVMRLGDKPVGELGVKHGMITSSRFAQVAYDWDFSLYEDSEKNIVGKSFVVRQGDNEADYRCATIQATTLNSLRPGFVPCEIMHYSDCLVGTAKDDVCIYRPCTGYRRYWREVDRHTLLCLQHEEEYPKAIEEPAERRGVVGCKHGKHTLLKPADIGHMAS